MENSIVAFMTYLGNISARCDPANDFVACFLQLPVFPFSDNKKQSKFYNDRLQ